MFVPSVSGLSAGAALTTAGRLQTPPDRLDFMTLQFVKVPAGHDDQMIRSPAGETTGRKLLSSEALTSVSDAVGSEIRPIRMSPLPVAPFTNATVSPPRAVARACDAEPIC